MPWLSRPNCDLLWCGFVWSDLVWFSYGLVWSLSGLGVVFVCSGLDWSGGESAQRLPRLHARAKLFIFVVWCGVVFVWSGLLWGGLVWSWLGSSKTFAQAKLLIVVVWRLFGLF